MTESACALYFDLVMSGLVHDDVLTSQSGRANTSRYECMNICLLTPRRNDILWY
jgi:hypothetical protein